MLVGLLVESVSLRTSHPRQTHDPRRSTVILTLSLTLAPTIVLPRSMGAQLAAPVAALHAAAFALGYVLCKIMNFDEKTARTVSIETGAGR